MVGFAVAMAALFGLAAVAVDMGRVAMLANETQNVADIAATAGATNLMSSGTATTARADAQAVVAQNRLGGAAASIATADIQVGQYNPQTNTFTDGANPPDAVKATKTFTAQNLFVGVLGSSFMNSTVTRTATAGFMGPGQGTATLPLVIGDCKFGELSRCTLDPACLPDLSQTPNPSNETGWMKDDNWFSKNCADSSAPLLTVGSSVDLTNGQITPTLKKVQDCVDSQRKAQGHDPEFLIPVVKCDGNFNQSATIVGFAAIVVTPYPNNPDGSDPGDNDTGVIAKGGGGIHIKGIFKEMTGPAGGGAFGMGQMRLYN